MNVENRLKSRSHPLVTILCTSLVLAITGLGLSQSIADQWLIRASGEKGSINAHTTRRDLVRIYGAPNVVDEDIDVGEGETQSGTIVCKKDPQSKIEILWKDPETKTKPSQVQIDGNSSRWQTLHNVSLGTTLKQLEKLNGRPFHLAGFDWDYSGTVLSWNGGSLAQDLGEVGGSNGRVILRLNYSSQSVSESEMSQVMGDGSFPSSHPVMQKLDPKIYQIIWVFPSSR